MCAPNATNTLVNTTFNTSAPMEGRTLTRRIGVRAKRTAIRAPAVGSARLIAP